MKTINYKDVSIYDVSLMNKIIKGELKVTGNNNKPFNPKNSTLIKFSHDKKVSA